MLFFSLFLPLVKVDLRDLEDEVRESSTDTLNNTDGKSDFTSSINVGVLNSQYMSEFIGLLQNEGSLS